MNQCNELKAILNAILSITMIEKGLNDGCYSNFRWLEQSTA